MVSWETGITTFKTTASLKQQTFILSIQQELKQSSMVIYRTRRLSKKLCSEPGMEGEVEEVPILGLFAKSPEDTGCGDR